MNKLTYNVANPQSFFNNANKSKNIEKLIKISLLLKTNKL